MTVLKPNVTNNISCCTCATRLAEVPRWGESEKPFPRDRELACCSRTICGRCIYNNPRFSSYCPYCQISQTDNVLPPGLKDTPPYTDSTGASADFRSPPPPYTPCCTDRQPQDPLDEKAAPQDVTGEDTLHFLNHAHDSINSLSLRYGVPSFALRRANNISSDHLIAGRRTIIIPGRYYKGGVSLSPRPVEGEQEEKRKAKIRRWMVACKAHEYDVALIYLEQAEYDLQLAVDTYFADEEWERRHLADEIGRRGNHRSKRR